MLALLECRTVLVAAVFLVTLSAIPLAYQVTPFQTSTPEIAQTKFAAAVRAVQVANLAGATNSELTQDVQDLNVALNMIIRSEELERQSRSLEANNEAQQALSVLTNIQSSASALQARAQARNQQNKAITYALAPVFSLLVVFLFHYGLNSYRKYRTARMMNMRIRVRYNEKQD